MVPYYNPASVPMFGRSGSSYHHHHHHSPPTQNHPYFTPGAYGAGYHHHNPHSHHAGHQAAAAAAGPGGSGSPVGAGLGVGSAGLPSSVSSTQFSPSVATDFNCNHQYNPPYANMTPDSMAVAAAAAAAASSQWSQTSMYSSACAAARNVAAVAAGLSSVGPPPPPPPAPHGASSYEEWSNLTGGHPHPPHHMHPHAYQHHSHHLHPSFYNHHATSQQPSPPSSTPSSPSSSHSPSHHVFSTSSTTPNNNNSSNNNNTSTFKAEFGPCSDGNNQTSTDVKPRCISFKQEVSSQEMQQTNQGNTTSVSAVTSGGPSIGTPHSPDSGMAISDGVSSSGSPATNNGQQFHQPQHCLGGPSSNSSGSSSTNHSSNANNNGGNNGTGNAGSNGSDNSQQQQFNSSGGNMVHGMGSHHHGHGIHMSNIHQNSGNLNHHHHSHHQSLVNSHQNGIINVTSSGRPTQARSPYEWIKKQPYSSSCSGGNPASNNAKTRTKDKYRVVYSDTQRLELEKEFHFNRYITIRRKSDLASTLGLSERQVKIWFQNRRAKERKSCRKQEEIVKRERIATMVHMHNAVAAVGGMGGGMCNQTNLPNNGVPLSALM